MATPAWRWWSGWSAWVCRVPGEGLLIMAAIYAGSTHELNPYLVGVAAALGAIVGQMLGYGIGRGVGYRLLRRYGAASA